MSKKQKDKKEESLVDNIRSVIYALIIALIIRTFFFQPFSIPSGSMLPTLLIGDYLFVSKMSYGYSRHTIAFGMPLFEGRLFAGEVERGDVAVFKLPSDGRTDYIKRVIGLPGDEIQMKNGRLFINGEAVKRELVNAIHEDYPDAIIYRETLPNGVQYDTFDYGYKNITDDTGVYRVPQGHYFMMGDNRDNSQDSRFVRAVGFVPYENFVGEAKILFHSFDQNARFWEIWKYPTAIRWERLFGAIE